MTNPSAAPATLAELRPATPAAIMDLVAEAGVDVSPWSRKQDGMPVKNPRANPSYCYEWAFGGKGEPGVVCIWHEQLSLKDGHIAFEGHLRERALRLDGIATDRTRDSSVRQRARDQADRARRFDSLIQRAWRTPFPLRVVVLSGDRRSEEELGHQSSQVEKRQLDPLPWYVHSYDDDGAFLLVRGVARETTPPFVDQFSLPAGPIRREAVTTSYVRSAEVRQAVLARAKGRCELCGETGFVTASGSVYLETHHVDSLGNGGPDTEWNVVALCANDHRRAHHAQDHAAITAQLKTILRKHFSSLPPAASKAA